MPQYKVAVEKSRYAKIKDIVQSVARAQEVYYLANGKYAVRFDELDVNTPDGWTQGDRTSEELEQACMELNIKFKKMLEQIKIEQINKDF